jgi:hypothetical protein
MHWSEPKQAEGHARPAPPGEHMTDQTNQRFIVVVNNDRGEYSVDVCRDEQRAIDAIEQSRMGRNITHFTYDTVDLNAVVQYAENRYPTSHYVKNALD